MEALQTLIIKHSWDLHVWRERYGNGLYAMIAPPMGCVNEIPDISTGSDIEALELQFYLNDEGSWLPVVRGNNLEDVFKELEQKTMVDNDTWKQAVYDAFECIFEESDHHYGLRVAIDNKVPALFKPSEL
ncbi:MAG TPA: hypothetical protein VJ824_01480 [Bacillota bacterium]|nr:hypothetical protein [Bacillota bacterium]